MKVSDWVHTCHNMNKITGFVVACNSEQVSVQVTIPKEYGIITMPIGQVWEGDETVWMDDLPSLIDLSLQIHDKPWFSCLINELQSWKPAGLVFEGEDKPDERE